MEVTQKDIARAINQAGISYGIICLHSSLKSFGHVEGGASSVINGFLETGCSLIVPAFYYDAIVQPPIDKRLEQNGCNYSGLPLAENKDVKPYTPDACNIVKDMGAIPAQVLKTEGSVRGDHPVNSFAAIGPMSQVIMECQKPLDVYGPYKKIYDRANAYIVLAGVDFTKATPIHYAEQLSGRRLFRHWAKISWNEAVETEVGSCSEGFNNLMPHAESIEKRIIVGESLWRIYPFTEFIDLITSAITANPMITHCEEEDCVRCNDAVKGGPILNPAR